MRERDRKLGFFRSFDFHAPVPQDGNKDGGERTTFEAVEEARDRGSERLPYFSGGWRRVSGGYPRRIWSVQDLRQGVSVQACLDAASFLVVPSPDDVADPVPRGRSDDLRPCRVLSVAGRHLP